MTLTEAVGSGEKVKDREIGFGACGFSDVKEAGGDGWVLVGTSEKGIASAGGVRKKRRV